jgi:predicted nucleotidyltransferase component of viral defense system
MIPQDFIDNWRQKAPWPRSAMVEQDLVISRALVELYSKPEINSALAFRGGTALNKLFFKPAARYSEDLDFVQIHNESIGETLSHIRSVLDPWLGQARWTQKQWSAKLFYRFKSTDDLALRLKIEINTIESFSIAGFQHHNFSVQSAWFSGNAQICTYSIEELMTTKLRALYQRRKGRDLFDNWLAITKLGIDCAKVADIFQQYNERNKTYITRAQFEKNLYEKMNDINFLSDISPLLTNSISWDPKVAYECVMQHLVCLLSGDSWKKLKITAETQTTKASATTDT